jgi:hypothetical protein
MSKAQENLFLEEPTIGLGCQNSEAVCILSDWFIHNDVTQPSGKGMIDN